MMRALRAVSSEKGRDPRDFALVAYGGSGPVHAAGLAAELGVDDGDRAAARRALLRRRAAVRAHRVPRRALLPRRRATRSTRRAIDAAPRRDARRCCERASRGRAEAEWQRTADLRYGGQSWEIEVELPGGPIDRRLLAALRERFEAEHERLYGVRVEPGLAGRDPRAPARGARPAVGGCRRTRRRPARPRAPRDAAGVARRRRRGRPVRSRVVARAGTPSRARCSSTSTTRPSSSRPAGPCDDDLETGTLVLEREPTVPSARGASPRPTP